MNPALFGYFGVVGILFTQHCHTLTALCHMQLVCSKLLCVMQTFIGLFQTTFISRMLHLIRMPSVAPSSTSWLPLRTTTDKLATVKWVFRF